jgi:hypothetical protein
MPAAGWRLSLDPESRRRLRIFTFKLLVVVSFSIMIAAEHRTSLLQVLWFFCFWHAAFSGLAALVCRHDWRAAWLTAWDEMAAFSAIALLARLIASDSA